MATEASSSEPDEGEQDRTPTQQQSNELQLGASPTKDEEEEEEEEGDEDEEDEDEEPRLKYAPLTKNISSLYRNGDASSSFLVGGDKMVCLCSHKGARGLLTSSRSWALIMAILYVRSQTRGDHKLNQPACHVAAFVQAPPSIQRAHCFRLVHLDLSIPASTSYHATRDRPETGSDDI